MKNTKKITWRVPNGNPEHELPDGAILVIENEKQIASMCFDAHGNIQVIKLDKPEGPKE